MEKRSVKLKEITSYISRGITPDYVDEGLCVINQKCVRNNKISYAPSRCTSLTKKVPKEKMLKRGDILINSTGTGTLGRVAYKDDDLESTFDGHVTVLRVSDEINSRYINYYLNELQSQLENLGLGSTNQLELYAKEIVKIKIDLPDITIQNKIVDIAETYDKQIDNIQNRIDLLFELGETIYKEWFVRFRFPGHKSCKFHNGIPEDWTVARVADFGRVETGKTPSMEIEEYYGGDIPFIKTPDMHGNVFVIETDEKLSEMGSNSQKRKLLPPNSIMVTCIGTGGVVSINPIPAHTNQQINSIVLNNIEELEWLFYTCRSMKTTIEMYGATGTTMTNLSKGKFEKLKVIKPSEEIVLKYHDIVGPMIKEIKTLMYMKKALVDQKNLIVPRLISDRLKV